MIGRRGVLAAALGASSVTALAARPAAATRPVVNAYDHLARRLGGVRYRLSVRARGEDPAVRDLRREVVRLVGIVEDLVALEDPRNG